jgi:predicted nucleotidyltransferase
MDVPPSSLDAIRRTFASREDVRAAYVFGSRATGYARPDSDIDLGVLYRTPQALEQTVRLEGDLHEAAAMKVDLVDVGRASAFLALEIIRGERVFVRDPVDTDYFELYVLRRAGDLLPFERERQALLLRTAQ